LATPPITNRGNQSVVYRERPYSPTTVRFAAAAGVVLLAMAGLVVFWVTPTVDASMDVSFHCDDGLGDLAGGGGICALLAGVVIVLVSCKRAIAAGSWSSALVVLAGMALILLGFASMYLYGETWGSEGCSD
jgi:hypothetical protein